MKVETTLVHAGLTHDPDYGFVNPPVLRGSTVLHASYDDMVRRANDEFAMRPNRPPYGTYGSDTHRAFYRALMALEGPNAAGAWAYPTGLAACTTPLFAFVKAGDHALFPDTVYGPTREFAENVLAACGVHIGFYDPAIGAGIEAIFRPNTTFVMMESPGSHTFELCDVPAIAAVARAHGIRTAIDNTWATPLYFKPLDHGVDMVVHSATKFINGHSNVTMGVVVCNQDVWPAVYRAAIRLGQTTSCDDIYLAYRGLHTMAARVRAQTETARKVIGWLARHPKVERVLWPALETDPSYPIWKRDFTGATGVFGVLLKPECAGQVRRVVDAVKIFGRGYSWGGFESLLIASYGKRTVRPMPFERMFRVAIGLEHADDLIADLDQALATLG